MRYFHHSIVLLIILMPIITWAQAISEDEARQRALRFFKQKNAELVNAQPQLAYTAKTDDRACFYVYNNGDKGFVIIGGDKVAREILGYSFSGAFCYDSVPNNIRWWFEQYAQQISSATNEVKGLGKTVNVKDRHDIPNMIKTKWNQHSPYNDKLPRLSWLATPYDRLATGCVATAGAQIMKYWKHPQRGIGSNSYKLFYSYRSTIGKPNLWTADVKDRGGAKSLRFSSDFSRNTYRWDDMADSYTSSSTAKQKSAVATLVSDIGIACDMLYGQAQYDGSATPESALGRALVRNFGYSHNINVRARRNYDEKAWENLVYSELSFGRPVVYGGYEKGMGGHEFVIGGYEASTNLFFVNWGWGGNYDGYFTLSPTTNTHHLTSNTYHQDIEQSFLQNVMPENGEVQKCYLSTNGFGLTANKVMVGTQVSITELQGVSNSGYVINNTCKEIVTDLGIRLVDKSSGKKMDIVCDRALTLQSGYMTDLSFTPTETGSFSVIPIYRSAGEWVEAPTIAYLGYPTLTVSSEGFSDILVLGEPGIIEGRGVTDPDMRCSVRLRNYGEACTRNVVVFIGEDKKEGNVSSIAYLSRNVDFEAGETKGIVFDRTNFTDADKLKEGKKYIMWVKVY